MNKHQERSSQTRQNLLDAFWELYCVKRIEKITVRDIRKRLATTAVHSINTLLMSMMYWNR